MAALSIQVLFAVEEQQQEPGALRDKHIESWILQQYSSMSLQRPLTRPDLIALETRARAGSNATDLPPALTDDFKDWFTKTVRALKQVLAILCAKCV